jgi:hypothetical protein
MHCPPDPSQGITVEPADISQGSRAPLDGHSSSGSMPSSRQNTSSGMECPAATS